MLVSSQGWADAPDELRIKPGTGLSERPLLDASDVNHYANLEETRRLDAMALAALAGWK